MRVKRQGAIAIFSQCRCVRGGRPVVDIERRSSAAYFDQPVLEQNAAIHPEFRRVRRMVQ